MQKGMMTLNQGCEALDLIRRLTWDEYQKRRSWIARITDPAFDMGVLVGILTPTTYGSKISPPFDGAILDQDGPGDEAFDVSRLMLVPILRDGEASMSVEEAVRRGKGNPETNWGHRAMEKTWAARESIPESVWPLGLYAIFAKTVWRDRGGHRCVWYVFRHGHGWSRRHWFGHGVRSRGRLPSLRK